MPMRMAHRSVDARMQMRTPSSSETVGVALVEPLHVVRAGMRLLLSNQPDLEVLAEAGGVDGALEAVRPLRGRRRAVALVSLSLSGPRDSYWLIRSIREFLPAITILALGGNADDAAVSRALFAGADGFAAKASAPDAFLAAVRRVSQGETVLEGVPPEWLGTIADSLERHRRFAPFLTDREIEVLSVAAEGLTARQMGRRLGVRERTITTHLTRIYGKLGVSGRTAAVRAAAGTGLVGLRVVE